MRRRWSTYCSTHTRRRRTYGHPLARPVRTKDFLPWATKVRLVFDRNPTHEGLALACQELDALMRSAQERLYRGDKLAPDLRRLGILWRDGAKGLDVLTMYTAAVLHDHLGSNPAPDARSARYRAARAVATMIHAKPDGRDLGALEQAKLSDFLFTRYGMLAANVLTVVRHEVEREAGREAALSAPLS